MANKGSSKTRRRVGVSVTCPACGALAPVTFQGKKIGKHTSEKLGGPCPAAGQPVLGRGAKHLNAALDVAAMSL